MSYTPDELYALLPAVYRIRDAASGLRLKALVDVLAREGEVVDADVQRLYDDWFVETCQPWVAPYLGDLLAAAPLHPVSERIFNARAYVANTLGYRRRSGTLAVLEQAVADASGWPARAVEMFALLGWSQFLAHERPTAGGTLDLRPQRNVELVDGPFDGAAHTVEVRNVRPRRGRFNLPNVAVHVFRLRSYALAWTSARAAADGGPRRYRFDPAGLDRSLFNPRRPESLVEHLAREDDLPVPLRRLAVHHEREEARRRVADPTLPVDADALAYFVEPPPVFAIRYLLPGSGIAHVVPPDEIRICHLDPWPAARPASTKPYFPGGGGAPVLLPIRAAVDPVLGRLVFAAGTDPAIVEVSAHHGFPGDLGGGPYDRRQSPGHRLDPEIRKVRVGSDPSPPPAAPMALPPDFSTVQDAVAGWVLANRPPWIIEIVDSRTYDLGGGGAAALPIVEIPPGSSLAIVAAEGHRPHLWGNVRVRGAAAPPAAPGSFLLDGAYLEGSIEVRAGDLGGFVLAHTTVLPPDGGFVVRGGNVHLRLRVERAILGGLSVAGEIAALEIADSILQPARPDTAVDAVEVPVRVEGSTLDGPVAAYTLEASNTLFLAPVSVTVRQQGCVRFSFVPSGSVTPVRHRCQPELALEGIEDADEVRRIRARIVPAFTSRAYPASGYYQLASATQREIAEGADDGAEMGAYSFLKQPQREANARTVVDEYLRAGLDAGIFRAT